MIHVLHAIPTLGIGGAERLLFTLLRHTDPRGFRHTVVVPSGSKTASRAALLGADAVSADLSLPALVSLLGRLRPDAVHTHGDFRMRVAARLARVPGLFSTKHCALLPPRHPLLYRAFTHMTVATSRECFTLLHQSGIPQKELALIPNTPPPPTAITDQNRIALRRKYGLSPRDFAVGLCARLVAVKGHTTLIKAASLLRHLPFRFFFLGEGEERERLVKETRRMGLDRRITFLGEWEDPAPFFGMMDACVNCSLESETSSLALLEGMALGLPTAASHIGGNRDVLKTGGILFPPSDPHALALALIALRAERTKWSALAKAAYLARPSAEDMCRAYEQLYLSRIPTHRHSFFQ